MSMLKDFTEIHPSLVWLGEAFKYEDDIYEIINDIHLFENFSVDEVRALCRFMHCYAAPRDYNLLTEGESGDFLMLVLTGQVKVLKQSLAGDIVVIAEIGVGGTLGEMSMIDGHPRLATCTTTMPTDLAVLTRAAFNDVLLQSPRLGNKLLITLLQTTTGRLRESIEGRIPSLSDGVFGAAI